MSGRHVEPFVFALGELRSRLRRGEFRLDTRLAATELGAELGLSATPIREALSRLAGEGLLEDRRGEGFFVRRLGRADIVVLQRLSLAHLVISLDTPAWASALDPVRIERLRELEAVERTEQLFLAWAGAGGRALALSFARLQVQLGAARRFEPQVFEDLASEADDLLSGEGGRPRLLARLRTFHNRRIRLAGRFADLLERGQGAPGYGEGAI